MKHARSVSTARCCSGSNHSLAFRESDRSAVCHSPVGTAHALSSCRAARRNTTPTCASAARITSARWAFRCCKGRNFTAHDVQGSLPVVIINEALAKAVFPGEDPLGKFITSYGRKDETLQIVGVVGNVRHLGLDVAPRSELYQPLGQAGWPRMFFTVRTNAENPLTLLPAVQTAVATGRQKHRARKCAHDGRPHRALAGAAKVHDAVAGDLRRPGGRHSRRSGFMASCRILSRNARARSASAWRSARSGVMCLASSFGREWSSLRSACFSGSPLRSGVTRLIVESCFMESPRPTS